MGTADMKVELDEKEWQQVVSILGSSNTPWVIVNPLILKIVKQVEGKKPLDITMKGDGHGLPAGPN